MTTKPVDILFTQLSQVSFIQKGKLDSHSVFLLYELEHKGKNAIGYLTKKRLKFPLRTDKAYAPMEEGKVFFSHSFNYLRNDIKTIAMSHFANLVVVDTIAKKLFIKRSSEQIKQIATENEIQYQEVKEWGPVFESLLIHIPLKKSRCTIL